MARTYRKPQHWVKNNLERELADPVVSPKFLGSLVAQLRGQDGKGTSYARDPSNNSPNGCGYYGPVGKLGKRFAKRAVARIHRRRGSKEIKQQLVELNWDQQDDFLETQAQIWQDQWAQEEAEDDLYDETDEWNTGSYYSDDDWYIGDDDPWNDYIPPSLPYRQQLQADREILTDTLCIIQNDRNRRILGGIISERGKSLGEILADAIERQDKGLPLSDQDPQDL